MSNVGVETIKCTWRTVGLTEDWETEQSSGEEVMPSEKEAIIPDRSYQTLVIRRNSDSSKKMITITAISLKPLKIFKLNKYVNRVFPICRAEFISPPRYITGSV